MTTRYPELMVEQSGVVDDNGHQFLVVVIIFYPYYNDRGSLWESYHNMRKIWFKRVVEGTDTKIKDEERARVAGDDSDDECSQCQEKDPGDTEEDDASMGGNGDKG